MCIGKVLGALSHLTPLGMVGHALFDKHNKAMPIVPPPPLPGTPGGPDITAGRPGGTGVAPPKVDPLTMRAPAMGMMPDATRTLIR